MPRPKLIRIRLVYQVDGSPIPLEVDVEPSRTSCLFFDEHSAVEILGGFYETEKRFITRDQAIARFGTRAEAWFPKGKERLPLNKAFMKLAWGKVMSRKAARGANGLPARCADPTNVPGVICKDETCLPGGQP